LGKSVSKTEPPTAANLQKIEVYDFADDDSIESLQTDTVDPIQLVMGVIVNKHFL
jgi:hypothetical protein